MAANHSIQHSSRKSHPEKSSWLPFMSLLALVPGAVGILLIITALSGFLAWHTTREQVTMGCFYILFSFALSNAVQKQWDLFVAWLILGLATWLMLNQSAIGFKVAAAALTGIGVTLLSREFLRRRQQYLKERKK